MERSRCSPGSTVIDQRRHAPRDAPSWNGARCDLAQRTLTDDVAVLLEESVELLREQPDASQPLHRSHPIPARHHEAQRRAVLAREGAAVHLVGEERSVRQSVGHRQRSLECDVPAEVLLHPVIRPDEEDLDGVSFGPGALEHLSERYPGPLRRTYRTEMPLLSRR